MSKIPNQIAADIRKLAASLPPQVQGVPEYETFDRDGKTWRRRTGRLLEAGNINHERRMKKAYYKGGVVAYLLYFDAYIVPGPLKLQVWENISRISGKPLDPGFIKELLGEELLPMPNTVEAEALKELEISNDTTEEHLPKPQSHEDIL